MDGPNGLVNNKRVMKKQPALLKSKMGPHTFRRCTCRLNLTLARITLWPETSPDIMDQATLWLSTIGPITFWAFHVMAQDFLACDCLAPDNWDQMTHRLITI